MSGEVTSPEERFAIDRIQSALGPLDDEVRRTRAHIGSLVHCDPGIPVTIDELLRAIGRGKIGELSFHSGCWMSSVWWDSQGTQPRGVESMQAIECCLLAYLQGESAEALTHRYPQAVGFIQRIFTWLGPRQALSEVQVLMLERMLLPFDYFTKRRTDYEAGEVDCFGEGGRDTADERIPRWRAAEGYANVCRNSSKIGRIRAGKAGAVPHLRRAGAQPARAVGLPSQYVPLDRELDLRHRHRPLGEAGS
jgi:hypothetical protein